MVGSDMLLNIHKRLCELKGTSEYLFGNVSVLAVGDLYQLPPVLQANIYDPVRSPLANLHGSLWKDNFQLHELDEVMRQKNDKTFAELLCRVRLGLHTDEDIEILRSRSTDSNQLDYPHNALHVFAYNADVDEWNKTKLDEIDPDKTLRFYIHAVDDKKDSTGLVDLSKIGHNQKRSETAGMHTVLELAVGARVMLVYNVDTADGLVNGVIGNVIAVKQNANGKPVCVLVKFDNCDVGKKAIASSQWKSKYSDAVPIKRHEGKFEKNARKGAQITRHQFPLTLAWAVTIHKCQGLTLDEIVVSMKGAKKFGRGQAYVAFSRVKTLERLHITDFDAKGIKSNGKVANEMSEMSQNIDTVTFRVPKLAGTTQITIGHLNIHYFIEKLMDLQSETEKKKYDGIDIMCFTETYLTDAHNIDNFLIEHSYTPFRANVLDTCNHQGKHGIMICAASHLKPKELEHIHVEGIEVMTVVVETQKGRLVIVAVYRSPSGSMLTFLNNFELLLHMLPLHIPTVIIGDFNDNIAVNPDSKLTELMNKHGFQQLIKEPTTDSRSLVDHVYFNRSTDENTNICTSVNDIYYSDHDLVCMTTNLV